MWGRHAVFKLLCAGCTVQLKKRSCLNILAVSCASVCVYQLSNFVEVMYPKKAVMNKSEAFTHGMFYLYENENSIE